MSFWEDMNVSCLSTFFETVSNFLSPNNVADPHAISISDANEASMDPGKAPELSKKCENQQNGEYCTKQPQGKPVNISLSESVGDKDEDEGMTDEEQAADTDEEMDDEEEEYQETWGPILAIPDDAFVQLVHRELAPSTKFVVEKRVEGAYNHAVILNNGLTRTVVKVPVVGTEDRWKQEHGCIMRSEAHTMTHIKEKLHDFPIPEVLGFDETFENEIGAPYTVLSFMEGVSSDLLWYDRDEDDEDDVDGADWPSPDREQLRIAFLRSLAGHMAKLQHLEFDGIGMIFFADGDSTKPVVGPCYGFEERGYADQRRYWKRPVFNTASEYYNYRLNDRFSPKDHLQDKGMRFMLERIFTSAPFASSKKHPDDEKETFTIAHNDLAFQNVLVNPETGEVTGIIDWDSVGTVPRCVGHITVPDFLQRDWQPDYVLPEGAVLSPWTLNRYRKVYAEVMIDACGGPDSDAKYTEKSGMYGPIQQMIYGGNAFFRIWVHAMLEKLMLEIPLLRRYGAEEFQASVGKGWPEAREVLEEWMPKVVDYRNV